jgi:endonuclease/exonuclease/phosphatase family metal-dependent hydrolase
MKIIQLNIWYGKLGNSVIRFLNQQNPDIVCLQEVSEIEGSTGGMFIPLHVIQEKTGLAHASFGPTASYRFMTRKCQYGNVILSKLPLEHEETIFVHGQYNDDYDRAEGDYNNRNLQTCQVKLPSQTITVINHHGFHIPDPVGNDQSLQAMEKVADILKSLDGPRIFCADLNVSPDSPVLNPLSKLKLRNLTAENQLSSTLSKVHHLDMPIACDYIFVSPDIKVTNFETSDEIVSDHKPLILEFDLP